MIPGITHPFVKSYMENCLKNSLKMQELKDIISCVLLVHMKNNNPSEHYDGSSDGGYPIPLHSTT